MVFAWWVGIEPRTPPAGLLMAVAFAFGALFIVQCVIAVAPRRPIVRGLYPWFYGGLFLDEQLSRLIFSIWPPPSPTTVALPLPMIESTAQIGSRS